MHCIVTTLYCDKTLWVWPRVLVRLWVRACCNEVREPLFFDHQCLRMYKIFSNLLKVVWLIISELDNRTNYVVQFRFSSAIVKNDVRELKAKIIAEIVTLL